MLLISKTFSLEIKVRLLTLHVAMQIGLYLHRIKFGVWRVVSEDSDHFRAWLVQMFFVVVVSLIAIHTSHAEVLLHRLQTLDALRTLCNYKLMSHLESSSIASSI